MRLRPVIAGVAVVAFWAGWLARAPRAVPEEVVRWLRGPETVRERSVVRREPPSPGCLDDDRVALALVGLSPENAPPPPETESACRARIALASAFVAERQLERTGRPAPFPANLPAEYREARFTEVMREVARTCPEFQLQRIDCSEFPCLALFVTPPGASPAECAPWREVYGDGITTSNGVLRRPDGTRLDYRLVGPYAPQEYQPPDDRDPDDLGFDNGMKRLTQRAHDARDEIAGRFDAREYTEAEKHEIFVAEWQARADAGEPGAAEMLELMERMP